MVIVNIFLIGVLAYQAYLFKNTAAATQKYADTAADTAERQLRAYVHVDIGGVGFPQKDIREVRVQIKNSGQTPAYDLSWWMVMRVDEHPLKASFEPWVDRSQVSIAALPAGGLASMVLCKQIPLSAEDMRLLTSGERALYVLGEITYKDVFRRDQYTKHHFVARGMDERRLEFAAEGNEAT